MCKRVKQAPQNGRLMCGGKDTSTPQIEAWPVWVGKAALEYQILSDSLHGTQERVGGTKATVPWLCN